MTKKELELLKIEKSPLTPDLISWDYKTGVLKDKPDNDDDYCITVGKAKYYNFYEAQALLNDLEKHIQ
jgi:hypothetical protein